MIIISSIFVCSIDSNAQEAECKYLTTEKRLKNRIIQKSKDPIFFKVTEEVAAQMIFTNGGYKNTLMVELVFENTYGYLVELGNILTLNFEDGMHIDFIASSKRAFTSVAYFTLLKPANGSVKKTMAFEDQLLYERFIKNNIVSLTYNIENTKQKISVNTEQSDLIKKTIQCLIFS